VLPLRLAEWSRSTQPFFSIGGWLQGASGPWLLAALKQDTHSMALLRDFYASTVGKKIAMALSGVVLVLFVVGHMLGNLKIFGGVDPSSGVHKIDAYAEFLHTMGAEMLGREGALWLARVGLLAALLVHAISGIQLAVLNRRAKPLSAAQSNYRSANAASRTMLYGGLFLLLFIVFHILHFTTGSLPFSEFKEGQVYRNVWLAFQSGGVVAFYVVAMAFLTLHLYHGTWSMFQTLGVDTPRWNAGLRSLAKVVAAAIFLGFSAVPVGIVAGLLQAP
jgi:succinate dehydrogenase / fumarate reductase cytochrome b subunit